MPHPHAILAGIFMPPMPFRAPAVSVLLYHHVGPDRPGTNRSLTTPPQRFRRHLQWMRQERWSVLAPSAWRDAVTGGHPIPDRSVVLTFDDGYDDLAQHAFPRLLDAGFGAGVYVVTALAGGSNTWEGSTTGGHRLLAPDTIRHWSHAGIEFGAHTRTHRDLRSLGDDALEDEVGGSARDLASITGTCPRSFAYPWGFHDARMRAAVRRHFETGSTVEEGRNDVATDPDRLRRTMAQRGDTRVDFACRLRLGYDPSHRIRVRIARWRGRVP
jgi:peptidoglycan/xylan/chitin deacetylase (PgdA/CDA1 family)